MRVSKDGVTFHEIVTDIDPTTGVDSSLESAKAKGYKPYVDVTKDGKKKFTIEGSNDSVKAATDKGYKLFDSYEAPPPNVIDQAIDKVKSIPGGLVDGAKALYQHHNDLIDGKISLADQGSMLATGARGALDSVVSLGDAIPKAVNNLVGLPHLDATAKPTAQMLDDAGLANKASLDAQDAKNPGSRMIGKMIPSLAMPANLPGVVAGGALGSAGSSLGDTGKIDGAGVVSDALVGAGAYGAMKGAGALASATGDFAKAGALKAGRIVTGVPEDTIERYATRNAQVRAAPSLEDQARTVSSSVGDLAKRAGEGSNKAYGILDSEGVTVPKAHVLEVLDQKRTALLGGVGQTARAERSALNAMIEDIHELPADANGMFSGSQVKGIVGNLDTEIGVVKKKAADRVTEGQREFIGARSNLSDGLKEQSPAYSAQMEHVAADTELAKRANQSFGSPENAYNTLKGVARERSPFRSQTLSDLDEAVGMDASQGIRDSMARDAFKGQSVNGSRNVNLFSEIPVIGKILGYAADYVAKPFVGKTIDWANAIASDPRTKELGKFAKPLIEAAAKGPAQLLLAHQLLMKNPEYQKKLAP